MLFERTTMKYFYYMSILHIFTDFMELLFFFSTFFLKNTVILDNYQQENQFQLFQHFIVTGCVRMGVEEYGVKKNFQALQKQYDGCIIECSSFGTMIELNSKRKKISKVLKRFPENFKKNYTLMDRNSTFAKKVVGKKVGGGGKKKKKGRRKKK